MKLFVTGAGGMLGQDIVVLARSLRHEVTPFTHEQLDVTDPKQVERAIVGGSPGAVINCASWTDVDGAEEHEAEASRVNGEGAMFVADAAAQVGAKMVQISTDYVFDGSKGTPYVETDDPAPLQAYGRTKLAAELAVALANERSFIVRTAWLFGPEGSNFVESILRLGALGEPVLVVRDQVGCPTYTGHLAQAIMRLADGTAYGIHHMAGSGSCSRYEFAEEIFRQAGIDANVISATTDMFESPATRPANSSLRSGRELPIELPDWQVGLADYLKRKVTR